MKYLKFFSHLFSLIFLHACLPTTMLEEVGIINTRGVDLIEEDGEKMVETTIIPYLFDPNTEDVSSILVGRGHTIKQAREKAAKQSSYQLVPGQIRLEVYGKEAAKSGILRYVNTLIRDARVSDTIQMAVSNVTAKEILEAEQSTIKINTAQFLQDLLIKEAEFNTIPKNSLHSFTRTMEVVGLDPVLPVFEIKEGFPTLSGIALFHEDSYVGSTDLEDGTLINLMIQGIKNTTLEVPIPLENYQDLISKISRENRTAESDFIYIILSSTRGKSTLEITNKDPLHFKADIALEAEVLETSVLMDLSKEEASKQMEKDIEEYYIGKYESLFAKLQELNADPLGFGQLYTSTREGSGITQEEWLEKYSEVTVDFNVEFTITNFGTIN